MPDQIGTFTHAVRFAYRRQIEAKADDLYCRSIFWFCLWTATGLALHFNDYTALAAACFVMCAIAVGQAIGASRIQRSLP